MTEPKENFAAQFRGLRLLLGKDNKSISGEAFSHLSGIALGTLRSIENGLRRLSEEDLRKIQYRLCAKWNARKGRWVDARDERIPYSRAVYDQYTEKIFSEPHSRELDAEALALGIYHLLHRLPKETYHLALFDLHDHLMAISKAVNAPVDSLELLETLKPTVTPYRDPKTGQVILESLTYPDIDRAGKYIRSDGPLPFRVVHPLPPLTKKHG
jgi:hypothetical protein